MKMMRIGVGPSFFSIHEIGVIFIIFMKKNMYERIATSVRPVAQRIQVSTQTMVWSSFISLNTLGGAWVKSTVRVTGASSNGNLIISLAVTAERVCLSSLWWFNKTIHYYYVMLVCIRRYFVCVCLALCKKRDKDVRNSNIYLTRVTWFLS